MSVVPLIKVTLHGPRREKRAVLSALQDLGCLHLIPLRDPEAMSLRRLHAPNVREALRYLHSCPGKRKQARPKGDFDPKAVMDEALVLKAREKELQDEKDDLRAHLRHLRPWGNFAMSPVDARHGFRLWFYEIPHQKARALEERDDLIFHEVHRDQRLRYVVVVAKEEPTDMPVDRSHTGSVPLADLERRNEEVDAELEDVEVERFKLARWTKALAGRIASLEDSAARADASQHTIDTPDLFAVQGWCAEDKLDTLREHADRYRIALEAEEPDEEETPPTLLRNAPPADGGQDLVTFYMTPDYHLRDPSGIVFFSFTIFFAMILSDAGYGFVLALVLGGLWRKMGRSPRGIRLRRLFLALTVASIGWGVAAGSYFGVSPTEGSFPATLKLFDVSDFGLMMPVSILVGAAHICLANALEALHLRGSPAVFAPLGWIAAILGGVLYWLSSLLGVAALAPAGLGVFGLGLAAVFFFSKTKGSLVSRILGGLGGLSRLTGAFGDVLSYMRLFALGLASSALAISFNQLAGQASGDGGGMGFLFGFFIIFIGHTLNFVLCIMSGVIHGLRLNFIEFFNWSLSKEGRPFRAFRRKEKTIWTS